MTALREGFSGGRYRTRLARRRISTCPPRSRSTEMATSSSSDRSLRLRTPTAGSSSTRWSSTDGGSFANEMVKHSGGTGARIWGPVLAPSTILALAFAGGGQVVVAGAASATGLTTKFDGRSGARLWSEPIEHLPNFVVIGSDGSVMTFAEGYIGFGVDQHPELQAVSYAGSNGSPLWGPVVARNEGASTWPLALLVDRGGGTGLLTLSGWGPGSILKYASDGHDLWGPVRFQGGSSSTGGPAAATLDLNGDILIARSNLVSKYSGLTGKLV